MPERQPALLGAPLPLPPLMRAHSDSGDIFLGERFRGLPWAIQPCACCGGTRSKLPTKDACSIPNVKENPTDANQGSDFWRKRSNYLECELKRASAANNKLMAKVVDLATKINELTGVLKEKDIAHATYKKTSEEKTAEGYSIITKLQAQLADIKQKLDLAHQECSFLNNRFSIHASDKQNQNKPNGNLLGTQPGKFSEKNGAPLTDPCSPGFSIAFKDINGSITEDRELNAECLLLALENSPVVVAHMDLQLRYTWTANFSLFGQKEVVGKRDYDILPPGTSGIEEAIEIKQRAILSGQQQKGEVQWKMNGRDPVVWVLTAQPLRDKTGTIIGVAIAAMDVTEETLFRERLMVVKAEMMIRSATERELQRATMMAEEAKSAKSMFLAIMSHEIRTPLNGMLGLADILLQFPLPAEQKDLVRDMIASGNTMSDILSDLLDLASVETGTMKVNEIPYNPSEMIDKVFKMATSLTRDKNIEVKCEIDTGLPSQVIGDESKVRQVLKCLVLNAVKFTQKGYIKIKISICDYDPTMDDSQNPETGPFPRCQSEPTKHPLLHLPTVTEDHLRKLCKLGSIEIIGPLLSDVPTESINPEIRRPNGPEETVNPDSFWDRSKRGPIIRRNRPELNRSDSQPRMERSATRKVKSASWLFVQVADSGVGIPEEAFEILFDKFTQVSCGPTRNHEGTGLGLAICKQLVELMGGHLTVSSKVNHGSTFSFSVQCKLPNDIDCKNNFKTRIPLRRTSPTKLPPTPETTVPDDTHPAFDRSPSPSVPSKVSKPGPKVVTFTKPKDGKGNPIDEGDKEPMEGSDGGPKVPRPIRREKEKDDDVEHDGDKEKDRERPKRGNNSPLPKILLAEDNKVNVVVANSMLKRLGIVPTVASNGVEAMEAIKKEKYDLLLLDICMPLMDGLQTAFLIRQYEETGIYPEEEVQKARESNAPAGDEKQSSSWTIPEGGIQGFTGSGAASGSGLPRLPIIAVTANALASDQERCFAVGMDAFIAKPIKFQTLKDTMSKFITLPSPATPKSRSRPDGKAGKSSSTPDDQGNVQASESRSRSPSETTQTLPVSSSLGSRQGSGSQIIMGLKSLPKSGSESGSRVATETGSEFGKPSLNEGSTFGGISSPKSSFTNSSADPFEPSLTERIAERRAKNAMNSNGNPNALSYLPPVFNPSSSNISPARSRLRHATSLPASAIHVLAANNKPSSSSSSSSSIANKPSSLPSPSPNGIPDSTFKVTSSLSGREKMDGNTQQLQQRTQLRNPLPSPVRENDTLGRQQQQKLLPSPTFSFNNVGNEDVLNTPNSPSLSPSPRSPGVPKIIHVSINRPSVSVRPSRPDTNEYHSDFGTPDAERRRFPHRNYESSSADEDSSISIGSRTNVTTPMSNGSRWKAAAYVSKSGDRNTKGEDRMAALISARLESLHAKHSRVSQQQIPRPNLNDYENYSHRSMFQ